MLNGVFLAFVLSGPTPAGAVANSDKVAFLAVGLLFLLAAGAEFTGHLPRTVRREILADTALLAIATSTMLLLYLQEADADAGTTASAAVFAVLVAAGFSAYGVLALGIPNPAHLGLLVAMSGICSAVLAFAPKWLDGTFVAGQPRVEIPIALACLLIAVLVTAIPRPSDERRLRPPSRQTRAVLTTLAVAAACGALALIAKEEVDTGIATVQGSVLIGLLAAAIAVRILLNQVRGTHAQVQIHEALRQKELALRETDAMLARLQRANETLRDSEERLRAVFESAADGIVELDQNDVIVRANGAFCALLGLPPRTVEGRSWASLAGSVQANPDFGSLPVTGQGAIQRNGQPIYLDARTSEVPGDPPGRLLLVRDVTKARVADQTIRQLFKFLQDRDEDRTRIMRRTNAAIESERNRIARDLHDGPVQGVSAASLSMEAVLLMLKAGDIEEGTRVLAKVRKELSEEADGLRQLMSGLRPPLLEERGLIPALREMLDRYGNDNGVQTHFNARANLEVPQDLEMLAYRLVQESLANSAKHAKADNVTVWVDAVGAQLRIEVTDDGVGFESGKAREYLQMGRVGLASMRERVELANGTFMVHSTPGKGTTVLATLPLDEAPAAQPFSTVEASEEASTQV
jgi:PAS domain S-box-containing protein